MTYHIYDKEDLRVDPYQERGEYSVRVYYVGMDSRDVEVKYWDDEAVQDLVESGQIRRWDDEGAWRTLSISLGDIVIEDSYDPLEAALIGAFKENPVFYRSINNATGEDGTVFEVISSGLVPEGYWGERGNQVSRRLAYETVFQAMDEYDEWLKKNTKSSKATDWDDVLPVLGLGTNYSREIEDKAREILRDWEDYNADKIQRYGAGEPYDVEINITWHTEPRGIKPFVWRMKIPAAVSNDYIKVEVQYPGSSNSARIAMDSDVMSLASMISIFVSEEVNDYLAYLQTVHDNKGAIATMRLKSRIIRKAGEKGQADAVHMAPIINAVSKSGLPLRSISNKDMAGRLQKVEDYITNAIKSIQKDARFDGPVYISHLEQMVRRMSTLFPRSVLDEDSDGASTMRSIFEGANDMIRWINRVGLQHQDDPKGIDLGDDQYTLMMNDLREWREWVIGSRKEHEQAKSIKDDAPLVIRSRVGETSTGSELLDSDSAYHHSVDSQDIEAALQDVHFPLNGWEREDVTAVIEKVGNAEIDEVWVSDTRRPYDPGQVFERII